MELRRLPLEGIRPIISILNLASLVKLHLTLDKSIQRLLSASGAFSTLHISSTPGVSRIALLYFLRSVRNVAQLSFDRDVQWSGRGLSLLASMNPAKVVLSTGFTQLSAATSMKAHLMAPTNAKLMKEVENLSHLLLPNFARLTPQLESLCFQSKTSAVSKNYIFDDYIWSLVAKPGWDTSKMFCFPPALTSFQHNFMLEKEAEIIINSLPAGLRSFSVTFATIGSTSFELYPAFTKFTELCHFSAGPIGKLLWRSDQQVVAPRSLNRFFINSSASVIDDLMKRCDFRNCTLVRFDLRIASNPKLSDLKRADPQIDLPNLLPPSLLELTISQTPLVETAYSTCTFPAYPSTLTSLALRLARNDDALSAALSALPSLTDLWLGCDESSTLNILASADELHLLLSKETGNVRRLSTEIKVMSSELPRKLLHLGCEGDRRSISEEALRYLPSGLQSLSVEHFDISLLPTLSEHLPRCHLKYEHDPFPLQGLPMMTFKAARWHRYWRPSLDLLAWSAAVADYTSSIPRYSCFRIDYPSDYPFTSLQTHEIIFRNKTRPAPHQTWETLPYKLCSFNNLLTACPNVTKLVVMGFTLVHEKRFKLDFECLPAGLKELEVTASLFETPSKLVDTFTLLLHLERLTVADLPAGKTPWHFPPQSVRSLCLTTSEQSLGSYSFPTNLKELTIHSHATSNVFPLRLSKLPSSIESLHLKATRNTFSFICGRDKGSLEHLTSLKHINLTCPTAFYTQTLCEKLPPIEGLSLVVEADFSNEEGQKETHKDLATRFPFIVLKDMHVDQGEGDQLSKALSAVNI